MAYTKYSLTPANNNAAPPDGAPEGMLPSAVNDTMRDMMAQIRDVGDGIRGGTYTMTAPVITGGSITGVALSGNTFTNPVITGGSINNTPIGASTANTGAFTTLGATGVATFSAGTVSAPAITTTGDTNTGIFFPAADTIAFTEGGVESMRIDASGNIGVGTSSPVSKLDVAETATIKRITSGNNMDLNFYNGSGVGVAGNIARIRADGDGVSNDYGALSFWTGRINSAAISERMRITSAGDLGIGTSSPANKLHVVTNSTTATAKGLTLTNTAVSTGSGQVEIDFITDQVDGSTLTNKARITASLDSDNPALGYLAFSTRNSTIQERMRLNSTGALILQGGATNANGVGITFPATQSASSNANTLDDYEEGTWTPTLGATGSNPTVTYSANVGRYTKIGRLVNIQFYIETTARSGGSGTVRINGLPFAPFNDSVSYGGVAASQVSSLTGVTTAGVRPSPGDTFLQVMVNTSNNQLDISNWGANGVLLATLSYTV